MGIAVATGDGYRVEQPEDVKVEQIWGHQLEELERERIFFLSFPFSEVQIIKT